MIKIGDFSKLSQVPVKTLRYYDEVGLLTPAEVDRFTGYRYYATAQLPRLNRVLALKDLGFSLEQIGRILDAGVTAEQLRGMLRLRQVEQQARVREEQDRLARVEARLSQIEKEATMPKYEVVVKQVEPLRVASVRGVIPAYNQQGTLWNELMGFLHQRSAAPAGPPIALYHDEGYKESDVDVEAAQPIAKAPQAEGRVKIRELPAVTVASTIHHGPYTSLSQAYDALIPWIEANGYQIVGAAREVYLEMKADAAQDDPDSVTEVQLPVAKAG